MNLAIPLSGLRAAEIRQAAAANNIANLNTPGYRPRTVGLSEQSGGGVLAEAPRMDTLPQPVDTLELSAAAQAPSGVDLATEAVNTIANTAAYTANAAVIRVEDELLGALLDTRG
ncbi:MAG: hypothetical protein RLZZ303_2924 [Candidatus Hydrogenedentota bacterium]|jgi:flagellar basal-body rod protein FlgC